MKRIATRGAVVVWKLAVSGGLLWAAAAVGTILPFWPSERSQADRSGATPRLQGVEPASTPASSDFTLAGVPFHGDKRDFATCAAATDEMEALSDCAGDCENTDRSAVAGRPAVSWMRGLTPPDPSQVSFPEAHFASVECLPNGSGQLSHYWLRSEDLISTSPAGIVPSAMTPSENVAGPLPGARQALSFQSGAWSILVEEVASPELALEVATTNLIAKGWRSRSGMSDVPVSGQGLLFERGAELCFLVPSVRDGKHALIVLRGQLSANSEL